MASSVTGLKEWNAKLEECYGLIQAKAEAAVEDALSDHLAISNPMTPVRTGYLKRHNLKRMVERSREHIIGEYYNRTPYGPFVAFGTRYMAARDFVTPGFVFARDRYVRRCHMIVF